MPARATGRPFRPRRRAPHRTPRPPSGQAAAAAKDKMPCSARAPISAPPACHGGSKPDPLSAGGSAAGTPDGQRGRFRRGDGSVAGTQRSRTAREHRDAVGEAKGGEDTVEADEGAVGSGGLVKDPHDAGHCGRRKEGSEGKGREAKGADTGPALVRHGLCGHCPLETLASRISPPHTHTQLRIATHRTATEPNPISLLFPGKIRNMCIFIRIYIYIYAYIHIHVYK